MTESTINPIERKRSMKKQDFKTEIISNNKVADNFYKMEIKSQGIKFLAGQFFQISVPGHTLRRPFAPSHSNSEKFSYTYQIIGEGTKKLSTLATGTEVAIIAPLGNSFTHPPQKSTAILVGGGCGTPSLALLAKQLRKNGITNLYSIIGARTCSTVFEKNIFKKYSKKVVITTDDGSKGLQGNSIAGINNILEKIKKRNKEIYFYACGPRPMLRGVAELAQIEGCSAQLSFEEKMACGFGACMGCVIKINAKTPEGFIYKRVCQDGPIFNSTEIYW